MTACPSNQIIQDMLHQSINSGRKKKTDGLCQGTKGFKVP